MTFLGLLHRRLQTSAAQPIGLSPEVLQSQAALMLQDSVEIFFAAAFC